MLTCADLPRGVAHAVQPVLTCLEQRPDLVWTYGQGSAFSGFRSDSDLDLIAVWDQVPAQPVVSDRARFTGYAGLALEQFHQHGYDIDVQHVPVDTYQQWMDALAAGTGWTGEQWPLPSHVAAGFATGVLLLDREGSGADLQSRLQVPEPALVETVVDQMSSTAPGFVADMERAADRGDGWLHDMLAVQLHKMIYSAWFLVEGHYPPFPKHLTQWFGRLAMDPTPCESSRTATGRSPPERAARPPWRRWCRPSKRCTHRRCDAQRTPPVRSYGCPNALH